MAKSTKNTEQKPHLFSDEELKRLAGLFDVLIEIDLMEKARFHQLEQEPGGYAMPGEGRNCSLCERGVYDDGWFDKWGFKCTNCQEAVNKRIIPGSICRDRNHTKAIPDTTLAMKLDVKVGQIRRLIREGKIIARAIPHGPYVILRKDNPGLSKVLKTFTSTASEQPRQTVRHTVSSQYTERTPHN